MPILLSSFLFVYLFICLFVCLFFLFRLPRFLAFFLPFSRNLSFPCSCLFYCLLSLCLRYSNYAPQPPRGPPSVSSSLDHLRPSMSRVGGGGGARPARAPVSRSIDELLNVTDETGKVGVFGEKKFYFLFCFLRFILCSSRFLFLFFSFFSLSFFFHLEF
jgi:hypothetical protein